MTNKRWTAFVLFTAMAVFLLGCGNAKAGTVSDTAKTSEEVSSSAMTAEQQTDADGYYNISVPIGEHYVEAKLEGHVLVDNGRFPTTGTYNFVDRVRHDFSDSTLVNFVGRVSGAKYNDTIPVGFAESHNSLFRARPGRALARHPNISTS